MTVTVGIPKGSTPGENRVALVPGIIGKYEKLGVELLMERGAGEGAAFPDDLYSGVTFCADLSELSERAQIMLSVQPPNLDEIKLLHPGQVVVGYMYPRRNPEYALSMRDHRITTFAMELLPRITRAQSMDALTSQAAVAGYKAVIMAANMIGRFSPCSRHLPVPFGRRGCWSSGRGWPDCRPSPRPSAWGPLWKPTTCAKPLGSRCTHWEHASLAWRLTPRAPGLCARTHRGGAATGTGHVGRSHCPG